MICPVCRFDNSAENSHCTKCAAALRPVEDEILASGDTTAKTDSAVAPQAENTASPPPTVRRPDSSPVAPRRKRLSLAPPAAGVSVRTIGDTLRLSRRWWHTKSIIVAGAMTPFLAYGASELFRASAKWGNMMICAGLIPGLIAMLAAFQLLRLVFNRTVIDVSDTLISIRHGPIPTSRVQQLKPDELNQIYVEEKVTYTKHGTHYHYDLWAVTNSDVHIKLLAGIPDALQAKYLERAIEERLGFVNRPVEGEWG